MFCLGKSNKKTSRAKKNLKTPLGALLTFLWYLWHRLSLCLFLSPQPWLPQRAQLCQLQLTWRSPSLEAPYAVRAASSLLAHPSICCHSRAAGKALPRCHPACARNFSHPLLPLLKCLTKLWVTLNRKQLLYQVFTNSVRLNHSCCWVALEYTQT